MADLIVFTDLDGTLLDHHDYSYAAARPALQRLDHEGCPLIFNTSKTAAEVRLLRDELQNRHPFIVENGSAVYLPAAYFTVPDQLGAAGATAYDVHTFGPGYEELLGHLHTLRADTGYGFTGFDDLNDEKVAQLTGLSRGSAHRARQRAASEPLIWNDTEEALARFRADLAKLKLSVTKGGRFYHVMGQTDKARAMIWLVSQFHRNRPDRQWTTVALGDGPNDRSMLEVADIAVIMPPAEGPPLKLTRTHNVVRPDQPGPHGWQNAIDHIFKHMTKQGA